MQSQRIGKACVNYTSPLRVALHGSQAEDHDWLEKALRGQSEHTWWKGHTSICVSSSFGKASISFTKMLLLWYRTTNKAKENFTAITKNSYPLNGCFSVRPAWAIIAEARLSLQSTKREDFSRMPLACWVTWDKALHPPTPQQLHL